MCGVRLDNRKVLRAPVPRTKYFERCFCRSINYIISCKIIKTKNLLLYLGREAGKVEGYNFSKSLQQVT